MQRRDFLKHSATVAGTALLPGTLPAHLSAQSANERVNVGVIGCGGMGSGHIGTLLRLREQGLVNIVAVCDVFSKRLDAAASRTGAKPHKDYRRLLEDKGVDAVLIATPDHWHARITVDAADAGKHVYCEKPMTYWKDLGEPKAVVKAIARNKRVMQVGTQGMSDQVWGRCAERIKAGELGKLIHAQASDCRNGPISVYSPQTNDPDAKPGQTLDWDMWLGSAPKRAYEPGRYFAFRSFWDYSGGIGTDFFPHILTPLVSTMGLQFPKRVVASGGKYFWNDGREVPDIFEMMIEYASGPSILLVASLATDTGLPTVIRGQQATLQFSDSTATLEPQRAAGKDRKRDEFQRSPWSLDEHWKDFLASIKSGKKPRSNEVLGYHVMTAIHMGIHSYHTGRALEFDPSSEEVRPADAKVV